VRTFFAPSSSIRSRLLLDNPVLPDPLTGPSVAAATEGRTYKLEGSSKLKAQRRQPAAAGGTPKGSARLFMLY
jgi:hypothetical protein